MHTAHSTGAVRCSDAQVVQGLPVAYRRGEEEAEVTQEQAALGRARVAAFCLVALGEAAKQHCQDEQQREDGAGGHEETRPPIKDALDVINVLLRDLLDAFRRFGDDAMKRCRLWFIQDIVVLIQEALDYMLEVVAGAGSHPDSRSDEQESCDERCHRAAR